MSLFLCSNLENNQLLFLNSCDALFHYTKNEIAIDNILLKNNLRFSFLNSFIDP